jgi:hypothetical protein
MDGRTFIVDLVRYGAWPVSAMALGWMFRRALVDLLGRITGLETKVLSFKSDGEVKQPRNLFGPAGAEQGQIGAPETRPGSKAK